MMEYDAAHAGDLGLVIIAIQERVERQTQRRPERCSDPACKSKRFSAA